MSKTFTDEILSALGDLAEPNRKAILSGAVQDMQEYGNLVGFLRGIEAAAEIVKQVTIKRRHEEDD